MKAKSVHDPENLKPIDTLWAIISRDESGNEGIVAAQMGMNMVPFITGDKKVLNLMREAALANKQGTSKSIYIVEYSRLADVEKL